MYRKKEVTKANREGRRKREKGRIKSRKNPNRRKKREKGRREKVEQIQKVEKGRN